MIEEITVNHKGTNIVVTRRTNIDIVVPRISAQLKPVTRRTPFSKRVQEPQLIAYFWPEQIKDIFYPKTIRDNGLGSRVVNSSEPVRIEYDFEISYGMPVTRYFFDNGSFTGLNAKVISTTRCGGEYELGKNILPIEVVQKFMPVIEFLEFIAGRNLLKREQGGQK